MSAAPDGFAPDEFDEVPEDGPRQGAHRGLRRTARVGTRELAAIVVAGVLTLGVGAVMFATAPDDAAPRPGAPSTVPARPGTGP